MKKIGATFAFLLVLVGIGYSFCFAMAGFDHNENMYVTAGVMISHGKSIYQDFAYLQMPYLPELYGTIYWITGTTHHVLMARIVSWIFWVTGGGLVGLIAFRITANRVIPVGLMLLYFLNWFMLRITIESSNYVLPATLALGQVWLILEGLRARSESRRTACIFLAGAAAGLSVGTKLSFLAAVAPFFALHMLVPMERVRPRRIHTAIVMIAGFLVALFPAFLLMMRDPSVFLFDNVEFHQLVTEQCRSGLFGGQITPTAKFLWLRQHYLGEFAAAIFLVLMAAATFCIASYRKLMKFHTILMLVGAAGALACTFATAVLMTPMQKQYLAMPVPYLLLLAACVHSLCPFFRAAWPVALGICVTVSATGVYNRYVVMCAQDVRRGWTPLAIEHSAASIRDQMQLSNVSGKVATMQPLYATEANFPVYSEFATGPFLYGVGDMLSETVCKRLVATSPETLFDLLDDDPPAAILTGFYRGGYDDRELERYARTHQYRPVSIKLESNLILLEPYSVILAKPRETRDRPFLFLRQGR